MGKGLLLMVASLSILSGGCTGVYVNGTREILDEIPNVAYYWNETERKIDANDTEYNATDIKNENCDRFKRFLTR